MIVSVFDYGAGNLHSLVKVLEGGGATVRVESDASRLGEAGALVLPGVGGFAQAAGRLAIIPGRVTALKASRVPQLGWNTVDDADDPLFAAAPLGVAWFANSFVARPADRRAVVAWSTHEDDRFPAAVRAGRAIGVQFHPEKSSRAGVAFVHAWLREAAACS